MIPQAPSETLLATARSAALEAGLGAGDRVRDGLVDHLELAGRGDVEATGAVDDEGEWRRSRRDNADDHDRIVAGARAVRRRAGVVPDCGNRVHGLSLLPVAARAATGVVGMQARGAIMHGRGGGG